LPRPRRGHKKIRARKKSSEYFFCAKIFYGDEANARCAGAPHGQLGALGPRCALRGPLTRFPPHQRAPGDLAGGWGRKRRLGDLINESAGPGAALLLRQ
jgi:hypothetical protein